VVEASIVGAILIALWLGNADVTKKVNARTLLCIGLCMETKADLAEGNEHDENDPSLTKIIKDTIYPTEE